MKQPLWLWLNLLSLDAPLVALVWQDFLARCYPSGSHAAGLRLPARVVLGLTVWAIYLADRLLDVRHPAAQSETARHRFYRHHRHPAFLLLLAILLADLVIATGELRPAIFSGGLWVSAAVLAYLAIFARLRLGVLRWKQPCAALLFTTGVFLVTWTSAATPWRTLAWPAAAFFALCLGNLALAEAWEHGAPGYGWIWLALFAILCAAAGRSRWYVAAAVSAAELAALDWRGDRISREARGVLADAMLLAPLLFR